ncbi:L-fuculose phosphate aldolase [uncultured archaeon]|nr:L-fuculose phosphate aldolase [uncultured archaeon]
MSEGYVGVKFETVFVERRAPKHKCIKELIFWCRKFSEMGIAPKHAAGSYGNMSCRTPKGFIITGASTNHENMKETDFAEVLSVSGKQVRAIGLCAPSSESVMHHMIYSTRPDINAIFHSHDDIVLKNAKKLGIPVTEKEEPYGTPELMEQAKKLCMHDYFILKNHGIISLGKTMKEAGKRAVEMHKKAAELSRTVKQ